MQRAAERVGYGNTIGGRTDRRNLGEVMEMRELRLTTQQGHGPSVRGLRPRARVEV